MSKVTIEIPPGYELVQTDEGKWEQRKIGTLPKTWEEFCKIHPLQKGECHIDHFTDIINVIEIRNRDKYLHRTYLPNRKIAEAFIALMQLIQLRNCYNGDWVPDWSSTHNVKFIISCYGNNGEMKVDGNDCSYAHSRVLVFKTEELRDQFLENFKDLIEIAKPLI